MGLYHILQLQIQMQNMPLFPVYVYICRAKFPLSAFAAWAFLAVFRTLDTGLLSLTSETKHWPSAVSKPSVSNFILAFYTS